VTEHGTRLEDNTLCHFKGRLTESGQVVASYATLAFGPDSYQAMHAAGCLSQNDCWFAGDPLPAGNNPGAFHLHWDGSGVHASPNPQGHTVEDMRAFELQPPKSEPGAPPLRYLFESVQLANGDKLSEPESPFAPSVLHLISPIGQQPTFASLTPGVPLYGETEAPAALGFLHLGADAGALWGAGDPASLGNPNGAEVTIVRYAADGTWTQLLGPGTDPPSGNPFTKFPAPKKTEEENANEAITSIAPDHSGESAWAALSSPENARLGSAAPALLARVSASGAISERIALPSAAETARGVLPKGPADKLACPALDDCWLATRAGWLFHLSDGKALERDAGFDQAFPGLITSRPLDAGIPQVQPDAPPPEEGPPKEPPAAAGTLAESVATPASVTVPLLSHLHTRLVRGTTLELSFHLSVRARVRLFARRHRRVVASSAMHTFAAGNRKLLVALNVHKWPTKLDLQTHALEPLPTVSVRGAGTTTVGTGLRVLPTTPAFNGTGSLP
jgi:hypothetical protein